MTISSVAMPPALKVLLTVEEAADRLNVGRTSVFALIKSGRLVSVRIGRSRRIPAAELEAFTARLVAEQCQTGDALTRRSVP